MPDLFSHEWMATYMDVWNAEPELAEDLAKIGFTSVIGYGFKGERNPKGVLVVENGKVKAAGRFNGHELDWDLRADRKTWETWLNDPPGMMGVGMAFASSSLQFVVGDYAAMIKDPRMAGPFLKSFSVMAQLT